MITATNLIGGIIGFYISGPTGGMIGALAGYVITVAPAIKDLVCRR